MYLDTFGLWESPDGAQSNIVMLKNVATKAPGRNSVVRKAIAFMAVLSRFDSTAMEAVNSAWECAVAFIIYKRC
jgi:hypothetical protein